MIFKNKILNRLFFISMGSALIAMGLTVTHFLAKHSQTDSTIGMMSIGTVFMGIAVMFWDDKKMSKFSDRLTTPKRGDSR